MRMRALLSDAKLTGAVRCLEVRNFEREMHPPLPGERHRLIALDDLNGARSLLGCDHIVPKHARVAQNGIQRCAQLVRQGGQELIFETVCRFRGLASRRLTRFTSLAIGDVGNTPLTDKFSFQVLDGTRTLHLHERMKRLVYYDGEQTHAFSVATEEAFTRENEEFVDALRNKREPASTHRDGYNATAIILAAFESSRSGCAVELSDRLK